MKRKPVPEICLYCRDRVGIERWIVPTITYDDEGLGPEHFKTKDGAEKRIEQWLEDHATELEPA